MDKISKQYVKNVKAFFPIIGKGEKNYLKSLEISIDDYCEEVSISSLTELYEKFGTPSEVVNTYYSSINTDHILNQLSRNKTIKRLIAVLIVSLVVSTVAYGAYLYSEYRSMKKQEIFFEEVTIE